jgi:hypothetical protein
MGRSSARTATLALTVVCIALASAACGRQQIPVSPQAIDDARLGVRVKTAIVNEPQLGTRIIEVRVASGVATLSGLVASQTELDRALTLARAVPGIVEVRSQLVVGQPAPVGPPPAAMEARARNAVSREAATAGSRRLLAVGGALALRNPSGADLSSTVVAGPMVRVGRGRGLGVNIGLGWFNSELTMAGTGTDLGRVTIRPLMGGLGYTFARSDHWSMNLSLVGGLAFNSVAIEESEVREGQLVDVDNSLAVRPGASLWYDVNGRFAINVFGGYVVTRPQTTFLERGAFTRRSVKADTAIFSVGLAYKLF